MHAGVAKQDREDAVRRYRRFLSVDPVHGGSANAYDYVTGNPVNSADTDGRRSWRVWWSFHWWGRHGALDGLKIPDSHSS